MPLAAPHACRPGCPELVPQGRRFCEAHSAPPAAQRATAHRRGYDARWRARREVFLRKNPVCVACWKDKPPRATPATVVDHIVPHKGDKVLFWDERNWQALCAPHHSKKTASEDGAFGNPVRR